MCVGGSGPDESNETTKKIDRELQMERKALKKQIKILLLGPGESGKSTIFKQMKILFMKGVEPEEVESSTMALFSNIIQCFFFVCEAMPRLGISFQNPENAEHSQSIISLGTDYDVSAEKFRSLGPAMKSLLVDPGFQQCVERQNEYYLLDSSSYFFQRLDHFLDPNFKIKDDEILHTRVKTTGITEMRFNDGNIDIHMFDVGGQRSERRKWVHCFEGVHGVIFCASLNCYDQPLVENPSQNKMLETLVVFNSIANSPYFKDSAFVLFLNFADLFEEKIKHVPLANYFQKYNGGAEANEAYNFICEQFSELRKEKTGFTIYKTTATDTKLIEVVFKAVSQKVIAANLKLNGLM